MDKTKNDDIYSCIQEIIQPYSDGTMLTKLNNDDLISINIGFNYDKRNRENLLIDNKYPGTKRIIFYHFNKTNEIILAEKNFEKGFKSFLLLNVIPSIQNVEKVNVSITCQQIEKIIPRYKRKFLNFHQNIDDILLDSDKNSVMRKNNKMNTLIDIILKEIQSIFDACKFLKENALFEK
jgi:hypothetical protein